MMASLGLEVARRTVPDLVLLDFVMPKYNGYQTLKAIRRFDNLQRYSDHYDLRLERAGGGARAGAICGV
jgi:CheY-like chemotaxis protein